MAAMLSVAEARARILAACAPVGAETVGLAEAHGRVLAAAVVARRSQPPADVSAMDGYALRAADAAAGALLRIVGHAPAGHPFAGSVGPGEAVRLFTGSVVPPGADAILIQENAEAAEGAVRVVEPPAPARHIRRAGLDFAAGETVIAAGRRLTPRDVGVAAGADHPWLTVHRRPRVAVLATGDEIALPGEAVPAGGIVSSNSHALAALIAAWGAVPIVLPIVGDDAEAIGAAAMAARGADLLAVTGGASVGDHDLVVPGLARHGLAVDFWKIAMRPGKPLMFGTMEGMPVLGMPGNPVSALVCAALFLVPALDRLGGGTGAAPAPIRARAGAALKPNDMREDYIRALLAADDAGGTVATPMPVQDSGMLRTLARADGLILRPPHAPAVRPGEEIAVIPLSSLRL